MGMLVVLIWDSIDLTEIILISLNVILTFREIKKNLFA